MLANKGTFAFPIQADARADGGEREISIERTGIIIARRLQGARMRLRVPARTFRGVVLSLGEAVSGRDQFRVSLWHADPDLRVILHEAGDDRDIVAEWRAWAAYFGLPKFIERAPGQIEGAERRLGDVGVGAAGAARRRGATISRRRPRLPLRRKPGVSLDAASIQTGDASEGATW